MADSLVSSETVSGGLSSYTSILSRFNTEVSNLGAVWNGLSHDNLTHRADSFVPEFDQVIKKQFENFLSALSLYKDYLACKAAIADLNKTLATLKDQTSINNCKSDIAEYNKSLGEIGDKITDLLRAVSSKQLDAAPISISKVGGFIVNKSAGINNVINWALSIANDNSHGYSQERRAGNPDYDCSSFVFYALKNNGYDVGDRAFATGSMPSILKNNGFTMMSLPDESELQPGDILWWDGSGNKGHTEIYLGNGQMVGAHGQHGNNRSPDPGDSGDEISVKDYSPGNFTHIFREE
jgi:hypothetical protein